MSGLRALLPHACIILSLMFLIFLVLDSYNPMMNFVNNGISSVLLALLCACSLASGLRDIAQARGKTAPRPSAGAEK